MIIAKPTVYDHILFRSQLEARWACFFTFLGIRYLYEPKRFHLPSRKCYCPDFYVPTFRCFIEVKPEPLPCAQREKMRGLARCTRRNVYTFFGDVGVPDGQRRGALVDYGDDYYLVQTHPSQSLRIRYPGHHLMPRESQTNIVNAYGRWSGHYGWWECTACAMVTLASADPTLHWHCACPEPLTAPHTPRSPRLLAAYQAANARPFCAQAS